MIRFIYWQKRMIKGKGQKLKLKIKSVKVTKRAKEAGVL